MIGRCLRGMYQSLSTWFLALHLFLLCTFEKLYYFICLWLHLLCGLNPFIYMEISLLVLFNILIKQNFLIINLVYLFKSIYYHFFLYNLVLDMSVASRHLLFWFFLFYIMQESLSFKQRILSWIYYDNMFGIIILLVIPFPFLIFIVFTTFFLPNGVPASYF